MISKICTNQEEKLKQMPHMNLTFVNRSTNFKMSTLAERESTDSHKREAEAKEDEQATIEDKSIPMHKLILERPTDSSISSVLKKMGVKEKEALTKLHAVAY